MNLIIIILALVLRLYGLGTNYWYNHDTARDILVARAAIDLHKIPLVGSFSSAGAFVFGPHWYWFLAAVSFLFPRQEIAVPLALIFLSLGSLGLILLALKTATKTPSYLIAGLFIALLPGSISSSWTVSQHGLVGFFAAGMVYILVKLLDKFTRLMAVLFGFSFGVAVALHFQALNLIFLAVPLFWHWRSDFRLILKFSFFSFIGFLIGLGPYLYWDIIGSFGNSKALLDYFLVGQHRFYVPNRWLTYVLSYWPSILGGYFGAGQKTGWVILGLAGATFVSCLKMRRKIDFSFWALGFALGANFLLFRFYKGPQFRGYLIFLDPIIIFLLGYLMVKIYEMSRSVAIILIFILTCQSLVMVSRTRLFHQDKDNLIAARQGLEKKYPQEKFVIYTNHPYAGNCSFNTQLVLDSASLSSNQGRPIGVCLGEISGCTDLISPEVISEFRFGSDTCILYNLQADPKFEHKIGWWHNFGSTALYNEVQEWWQK